MASSSQEGDGSLWQKVWSTFVRQKVCNFMWRALKNALPVGHNLVHRYFDADPIFTRCGKRLESVEHLLLKCHESRKLWYCSPLKLVISDELNVSFKYWVYAQTKICIEKDWWDMSWSLCWSLCLGRNYWVFNKKLKEVNWRIEKAKGVLG